MAAAAAAVEAAAGGGGGTVLVTGGAGFIGTHTVVELVTAGYGVVIADNLCNSCEEAVTRVRKLVPHPDRVTFVHCDVTDAAAVAAIFAAHPIDAVIHFAALKVRAPCCCCHHGPPYPYHHRTHAHPSMHAGGGGERGKAA